MCHIKPIKDKGKQVEGFAASQLGGLSAINQADATNASVEGMNLFRQAASKLINVAVEQKKGNLFEYIEAVKFNMDAATKGASIRAVVTAAEGSPHSPADVLIRQGNQVLEEVQHKANERAKDATYHISDPKYQGMQKVVPSDKVERVRELAEKRAETGTLKANDYYDTAQNVTGETQYQGISSGGTSSEELMKATTSPDRYAALTEFKQFSKEVAVTGAQAAAAGFIIGGSISLIKNSIAANKGEKSMDDAVNEVFCDAGRSGVRGGTTGVLGTGIRVGAQKIGVNPLAKTNIAMSLAAGTIDVGVAVYSYAIGDINAEQAVEQIGQSGISTMSAIYSGAVAGLAFGPAGAVVGSIAGYMISANVYQTCIAVLKEASLAEQEANRVIALYQVAMKKLHEERNKFEELIEERLKANNLIFTECFSLIDSSLQANRPADTIHGLSRFVELFGKNLKLKNFQDFDKAMRSDNPLDL